MALGTPRLPDKQQRFVNEERWTYTKTMPKWPHEYLVRGQVDERLFEQLVRHIRSHGYEGCFSRRPITYYEEDGLVYWMMGAPVEETIIINRCNREDTYEYRLRSDTLPP